MGTKDTYKDDSFENKYDYGYVQPTLLNADEQERLFQEADEDAKIYNESLETNPLRFSLHQSEQSQPKQQSTQPEPESGQTPPTTTSGTTDPFANTRAAMSDEHKTWRQLLIDNYKKREDERKKRLRSAQIVGLGKALGDLLSAAFAGAGAIKGNYGAIVPKSQASKSVEQIQTLINEGVITAKEYDNMMQNIAMQEGRNKIMLAKSLDEYDINQQAAAARRKFEKEQADVEWSRSQQANDKQREWQSKEKEKDREHEEKLQKSQQEYDKEKQMLQQKFAAAEAKKDRAAAAARAAMNRSQGPSSADKAILGRVVPQTITKTGMYGIPETVPNKPTDNEQMQYLYREYNNMRDAGLDPNKEADKQWWADNYQSIQAYIATGKTYRDVRTLVNQ